MSGPLEFQGQIEVKRTKLLQKWYERVKNTIKRGITIVCMRFCSKVKIHRISGSHFGRHLELRKPLKEDSREVLVCCSRHDPGPFLKISACYQKY